MHYRVALTTSNGQAIDLHFGQAGRFLIVDAQEDGTFKTVEWRDAPEKSCGEGGCGGWFDEVAHILPDVAYVFTAQIGPKAHRSLSAAGITPLETPEDPLEALAGLNAYLKRNPRVDGR